MQILDSSKQTGVHWCREDRSGKDADQRHYVVGNGMSDVTNLTARRRFETPSVCKRLH
ncbi:MAG: hypothetical protein ACI4RA_11070 [Kiritimatiellia bacterium]